MKIKDKNTVLRQIDEAFAAVVRPSEFVDASHCEECFEHNDTLKQFNRDTITSEQLGNPGWDPICFVYPQAFLYYFPAMVRLSFDEESQNEYLEQFLFHTTYQGTESRFFTHFNDQQTRAVSDLMLFLKNNWKKKIDKMNLTDMVEDAVNIWCQLAAEN